MAIVKGKLKPLHDKVLVKDMDFGEQKSASGIVILDDNGKDRGIHPRWAKVYSVGPEHKDEYSVGDWILVEHGRWTRGIEFDDGTTEKPFTLRMVDTKCVMMWSKEKPQDAIIGNLTGGDPSPSINPEDFLQ
jgi:co-chaperonin GroES (HSP10)